MVNRQGYVDVSGTLRDAMAVNNHLRVFIASGLYDLATPFFTARYTVSHMWLGRYAENVQMKTYESGHMVYTHLEELEKFSRDARAFYHNVLKGMKSP